MLPIPQDHAGGKVLGTVVEAEGPSLLVPWSSLSLQVSRNASGRLLNVPLFLLPFDENCSFSQQNAERASESKAVLIVCLSALLRLLC